MKISKFISAINSEGFARKYTLAVIVGYAVLAASPAYAQGDLRATAISIFQWMYIGAGAICGIALLYCTINVVWHGILPGGHDPKKDLIQSIAGTVLVFSLITLLVGLKALAGSGASINSL